LQDYGFRVLPVQFDHLQATTISDGHDALTFKNLEVATNLAVGAVHPAHQIHNVGLPNLRQGLKNLLPARRSHQPPQIQLPISETPWPNTSLIKETTELIGKKEGETTESDFPKILSPISILPKHSVTVKSITIELTTQRRGGAQLQKYQYL